MNMESIPKVSIVIPCFNGEKYLRQAIDSALGQSYKNIEVIVVNDGSSDRTEEIAMEYGDRIRYFRKENGGVSSALNLGISEMTGDYFSWLSHDDMYLPEKIEKQIKAIEERDEEERFVYSNFRCLIEKDEKYQSVIPANKLYGELCEKSVFPVLFNLINGCTTLIHRSMFEKYGLFDEELSTSQDYDMWMRLLTDCNPVYVEEELVITRIHDTQGSKTISDYLNNCQMQQIDMVQRLTETKLAIVFNGRYKFYADMIDFSIKNEWDTCVDKFYSVFEKIDENRERGCEKSVYVYGAGRNGQRILKECWVKDVNVIAVVDRKNDLWGHKICEVECIPLEDVPNNSEIWIAVEDDYDIKNRLIEKGFTVRDFAETNIYLFDLIPSKEKINELVFLYRKK